MRNYLGIAGAVVALMCVFFLWAAREMVAIHEEIGALRRDVATLDLRTDARLDRIEERLGRARHEEQDPPAADIDAP